METLTTKKSKFSRSSVIKIISIAALIFAVLSFIRSFLDLGYHWYRDYREYHYFWVFAPYFGVVAENLLSYLLPAILLVVYSFAFNKNERNLSFEANESLKPKIVLSAAIASVAVGGWIYGIVCFRYFELWIIQCPYVFDFVIVSIAAVFYIVSEFKKVPHKLMLTVNIINAIIILIMLGFFVKRIVVADFIYIYHNADYVLTLIIAGVLIMANLLKCSQKLQNKSAMIKTVFLVLILLFTVIYVIGFICYYFRETQGYYHYTWYYPNFYYILSIATDVAVALFSIVLLEFVMRPNKMLNESKKAAFDPKSELLALKQLYESGLLNEEEYNEKRSAVIAKL